MKNIFDFNSCITSKTTIIDSLNLVSNTVGTRVNTRPCEMFNTRFYLAFKTYFCRVHKIKKFKIQ